MTLPNPPSFNPKRRATLAAIATTFAATALPGWAKSSTGDAMQEQQALLVLNRLAYGPKPGDLDRVRQIGIERYIDEQLHPERIAFPPELAKRIDGLEAINAPLGSVLGQFVEDRRAAQKDDDAKQQRREFVAKLTEQTAEARLALAIDSPRQLQETLVDFWTNHFNVFSGKGIDRVLLASYERDAIRPYVLDSFRDMLGATAKHPAMLFYLDNWLSTADNFQPRGNQKNAGQKAKASGLNENYARELMELHTLGVDGGYTQRDVTELARMLTGWTFDQRELIRNNRMFVFDARRHDNGDKDWLGHHIAAQGQQEGETALDILAAHPATARHLSFKLAQYFVADQPPPALVDRMARRYLESSGNIRETLRTLFASREFLSQAGTGSKFKTPYQFVISAARAGNVQFTNVRPFLGALSQLGMPLYGCQTPDGYKNTQSAWLNPDALTRRISFATALASGRLPLNRDIDDGRAMGKKQLEKQASGGDMDARRAPMNPATPLDANALLDTLGSSIGESTRATIAANSPTLRAAMVLGSPDFMQR